jgi:Xaa-Pro aminopeptidase
MLLITPDRALLATDFRYVSQAAGQAPDFQIARAEGEPAKWFPELVSGVRRLGFEAADLSYALYRQMAQALEKVPAEVRPKLVPTEGVVEGLRVVKDASEVELIQKAARLADAALDHILSTIRPGMTEIQVAWGLERFFRENGSESVPFEIIVAAGPCSALPHARPTDRPIQPGEPIVLDFGARIEGYASDLTRTVCLGAGDETFEKVYDVVLGAQLTALATIQAGMTGEQADRLARGVIERAGYGAAFGHGLGHGVGLATHEAPRLGVGSTAVLAAGMVFTVEPGIYVEGWGGVRIEDVVILNETGPHLLTKAMKAETVY